MIRREFITLLGGAAAAWPLAARAQQRERMRRIGVLAAQPADDPIPGPQRGVSAGIGELGWNVGRNLQIDYRWGGGLDAKRSALAPELVALTPEVILAVGRLSRGAPAGGHPQHTGRVCAGHRSGRVRLCIEPGAARR